MTTKLLVRQGGGTAVEVDYASAFTARKGSPFLEGDTPLVQMGQRFANGESAQGYFPVVDPDAELSSAGFRLRPWAEVRLTEDASGDELTLAWMRLTSGDVKRRGVNIAGDEIEHGPGLMDCNLDLRGIPFRNGWDRPAENDFERLTALQAAKLNGSSSTRALHRITTDITIDRVSNGHLVKADPEVDLDAKKYPKGTEVAEIIADIAEQSGKIWGVVLHHDGGSTHKCLLYIDQTDLVTWTTGVRISDDPADWDPDHATTPTLPPHWMQGSGKEADYSGVISGLISIYEGQDENRHTVYVETGEAPEDWETWVGVYNDGEAGSLTPATRRANWILADRKRPLISHRVSLLVTAAQAHLATAGQAIEVKSVVLNSGPDKASFVWRRIAESKLEPAADGLYWLHLSLERPRRGRGVSKGGAQPIATTPQVSLGTRTNLLLGKSGGSLKASSENASWPKENAVDGNEAAGSHWSGAEVEDPVADSWFAIDLGASKNADGFRIFTADHPTGDSPQNIATAVDVYYSDDASAWTWLVDDSGHLVGDPAANDWTLVATHTGPLTAPADSGVELFDRVTGRYVLFHATAGGTDEWDVNEFEWWGWNTNVQPVGEEADQGDSGEAADAEHVHAHGDLSTSGTHHHDTTQVEGLDTFDPDAYVEKANGGKETLNTVAASGTTETLDLADGNWHDVTLSANCTFTFTGATNGVGCSLLLLLRPAGFTATWPAAVEWPGGIEPDLTDVDLLPISFITDDGGSTWLGAYPGSGGTGTDETAWVVDPGEPSYSGTGPVTVALTSKFGIDSSGNPYYNAANVTDGEEAALIWDSTTETYLLRPYYP